MKHLFSQKFIVGILLFLLTLPIQAAKIWVSPNGNDNNPGTEQNPLATLQMAQKKARELRKKNEASIKNGIEIILKGGTYQLKEPLLLNTEDSGTKESPTTFIAAKDETPIISGGIKVSDWQRVSEHIYSAHLNSTNKLRALFVNGKRMRMAGTEKTVKGLGACGEYIIKGNEPWAFGADTTTDGIKFYAKDVSNYNNSEDIELVQLNVWTEKIFCVQEIKKDADTAIVKLQQPYGAIATSLGWAAATNFKGNFMIRNAYELLDSPGEFYFNRKTQTLYFYSNGEDMSTAEVIAPVSDGLIRIEGRSTKARVKNIKFEGITFSYDHWQLLNVAGSHGFAGIQSLGLAVKYIPGGNWHPTEYNSTDVPRGSIQVQNAENISFVRNRFTKLSSAVAINLENDASHCEIIGNFFNDLLGNAVNIGHPQHYKIGDGDIYPEGIEGLCEYNKVNNNYIRNVSLDFRQVEGITAFFVANTRIEHNDIEGTPYGAITCGWWWGNSKLPASTVAKNNSISFNKAGNSHQVLDDGGIIYLLGEQPGTKIKGNYLFNGPRCIYPDDGSAYLTIEQNVINNPSYKWMWLHLWTKRCHDITAKDNYVKNNLLMNNGTNNKITHTYSFREDDFAANKNAQKIIDNAGIQDKYKDIIPAEEPGKVRIHPKEFKQKDVFH